MTDFANFSKRYQDHNKAVAEANVLNKAVVFDALAASGVTRVTAEFDGEGDSGQLNDITAFSGDTQINLPTTRVTLRRSHWDTSDLKTHSEVLTEAIETLCYDYLEQKQAGWENNEGAHGTFEFNVGNRTVSLEFNARFVDTTTHNYTF